MNKVAIAAAALLLLVLLVLPRYVGSITEARVRERVTAIDASPTLTAEVTAFDRGWFHSTAHLELRVIPDPAAPDPASGLSALTGMPLAVAVEFAHGPIAVLDGVHFGWSKMVARPDATAPGVTELQQTLGVPYVFEFRGRTSYLGALSFDADAPPFALPVDEALLTFSGATLSGELAGQDLEANAHIGALDFTSPTGSFTVRGVFANADNELRSQYVMPGEASLSIESITATGQMQSAMPLFEATNIKIESDVDIDASGELLEMRVDYGLDALRLEDNEIAAGALGVTVRNVDVAALEAYSAAAAEAASSGDPTTILVALGPHLERALQAAPSLTLDPIRFRYDDEPFDGRVDITTNTPQLPAAGTLSFDNPLFILGLLNVDASLQVSKALAAELATLSAKMQLGSDPSIPLDQLDYMAEAQSGLMLTMLIGQGVLVEDGDGYRTSVQLTNGAVTLNGNPLPFGLQ
jgi:uncharacterized protein YdgA (DUF945 family)